jgi:hypothetical protein
MAKKKTPPEYGESDYDFTVRMWVFEMLRGNFSLVSRMTGMPARYE